MIVLQQQKMVIKKEQIGNKLTFPNTSCINGTVVSSDWARSGVYKAFGGIVSQNFVVVVDDCN
jgi:hypothetical protein